MTVLVTGAAGFIGYHVAEALLGQGRAVVGVDNVNAYYDVRLKEARLERLSRYKNFAIVRADIADREAMADTVRRHADIEGVVHLAAQAGVRHSLIDPYAYTHSNVDAYVVLLEAFRSLKKLRHVVYASSSSVYGANTKLPFSVEDRTDTPLSLYAASKKAMEGISHAYAHIHGMPLTGLRFFTVYGPWGRPDMAAYIFTRKILAGEPIDVFNNGDMRRDFTYIDDIVAGVLGCLAKPPTAGVKAPLYNIGNSRSEPLMRYIGLIEQVLGKKATINFMPMQPGDVKETYADIEATKRDFGFEPKTSIEEGIPRFLAWYREFHGA